MKRGRDIGIAAVLAGLILVHPTDVISSLLPDLPDWTVILFLGGGADFGTDVSRAGDVNGDGFDDAIVAGWAYESHEGDSQEGAAWVYTGSTGGLGVDAVWTFESDNPGANFGLSADAAGDVNGDGYGDIVIGAPGYKEPSWTGSRGAAYVFHGSPDGLSLVPDALLIPTFGQGQRFGQSVAGAGDINGDGYDDLAAGVGKYDPGDGVERGAIFVYYGSPSGLVGDPDIIPADLEIGGYGLDLAAAGDVNGDGFADVIAGGARYVPDEDVPGAVYVYLGSGDGLAPNPVWHIESDQPPQAWFADSVAGAGDVNGDGFDDVLVGAQGYERPGLPEGAAFLYFGSPSGPSPEPDWAGSPIGYVSQTEHSNASYGAVLDGAGDVNGDGFDDIVIEANSYTTSSDAILQGAIFVYRGSPAGPAETPDWIGYAPDEHWGSDQFPTFATAGAGDVNGDGYADIIVGDYSYQVDDESGGGAAAYYGGPVDADDDDTDDDGDDDAGDDDGDDDSGSADDDGDTDVPDTNGSRGDSLTQDDDGPCGC